MTAKRTLAREAVLLSLYQIDLVNNEPEYALNTVLEELNLKEKDIIDFSNELLFSILDKIDEIDDTLESFSKGWKLFRMSCIDRNILRIATYEILYREDIPFKVSINEAIGLAKIYGDEKSPRFINGVLASVIKEKELSE